MDPEKFIFWLQGKLEDRDLSTVDQQELESIRDHLALCFTKETPEKNFNMEDYMNDNPYPPLYNPDLHSPLNDWPNTQRIC